MFILSVKNQIFSLMFSYSMVEDLNVFQVKRLKLRKNNWDSDTYEFDEVFTDSASQKRVYEVVAKPVIEVYSGEIDLMKMWHFFFGTEEI